MIAEISYCSNQIRIDQSGFALLVNCSHDEIAAYLYSILTIGGKKVPPQCANAAYNVMLALIL